MQPLATSRLLLEWLSMCPVDESTSTTRQKFGRIAHTLFVFMMNVICSVASAAYCIKFALVDFNSASFAFMIIIGQFGLIYFMIAAFRMRDQIGDIFTSLSMIYEKCELNSFVNKCFENYSFVLKISNNFFSWKWSGISVFDSSQQDQWVDMDNLLQIFCIYYHWWDNIGSNLCILLVLESWNVRCWSHVSGSSNGVRKWSSISVRSLLFVESDKLHDEFDVRFSLPWNQRTPAGYATDVCFVAGFSYEYFILNGVPLVLFISICLHHQAFYKMFKHSIDNSSQYDAKLLCDLIRFHILVKK